LISALLDANSLAKLIEEAGALGMDALVEVHSEQELKRALAAGATLIGVNNRDLRTFEVSLDACIKLAPLLPKTVIPVAESGIREAGDIHKLVAAGYKGFLIGEQFMKAPSPGAALLELLAAWARTVKKAS
jgi:indole-3-glycerol phosphate synthase